MKLVPDYHRFSSIAEYLTALDAAGLSLSVTACWLIQSVMQRQGCSFANAMDYLTGSGTLTLLPQQHAGAHSDRTPLPPLEERLKDLDA